MPKDTNQKTIQSKQKDPFSHIDHRKQVLNKHDVKSTNSPPDIPMNSVASPINIFPNYPSFQKNL